MARKINENSVRQRAFKLLDSAGQIKRSVAISLLKDKFNIGDRYAETLYASHRTLNRQKMVSFYKVVDVNDSKPRLVIKKSFDHSVANTKEDAINEYINKLTKNLEAAREL